ncbi:type IX secretion system membrane protein, PorP/SprF family [Chitinophaga jiangningensis]|uniref:Type IX secretion system membrane protein, PorP/SprF family n=1 Tax=Chitinophaga jiangningensis TaxID=1419482 RepID=A0A1M6Z1G3_9BACT|nr:type IX secretion system membrane protein PorP/SprF [Chitinophaga jiangningensis]SHL24348.1 type IX secretion system membrane protein, PorP/SprF family [Chitinophaga jiangningensis]
MGRSLIKGLSAVVLYASVYLWPNNTAAQQNLQFSQYVFNMLAVNPAYAGYKEDLFANAIYRKQWVSFPGGPQTGGVSVDGALNSSRDARVGLGAQIMYDKLGPQDATSIYGMYSYRIPVNEDGDKRLCFGIGAGVTQYAIDGSVLVYNDDNDPSIPMGRASTWVPDARFGIYYYTPTWYVGASVMDLFSLYTDASRYYWKGYQYKTIRKTQHLYVNAGVMFNFSDNLKLKPSILIKEDFKGPTNVDLTALFLIADRLWVGGSYRTGVKLWSKPALDKNLEQLDAASAIVQFNVTQQLRIGYAYDLTISKMASYQSGSHELSIGYLFTGKRPRVTSPRYF